MEPILVSKNPDIYVLTFESFGDELRYLSDKKGTYVTEAMESLLIFIIDALTKFLRDNYFEFPMRFMGFSVKELFLMCGIGIDPNNSLHVSFKKVLEEIRSQLPLLYNGVRCSPTLEEIHWYGNKLEEYFCKEGIKANYRGNDWTLELKW